MGETTEIAPDLAGLLPSWERALKAEHKSPATIRSYLDGVNAFLRWCDDTGAEPVLSRVNARAFVADLLDDGARPRTAGIRLLAIKRYSVWLADEGETDTDHLSGLKQPKDDVRVIDALTDEQLRALFAACEGKGFADRRDEAIVRLLAETGMRAGECAALEVTDLDLDRGLATVRRGKGGKGRLVPFGPRTTVALDRYLRIRRSHPLAHTTALWLGEGGARTFAYFSLRKRLRLRAAAAGIEGFHPHKLRHTFATRWKASQGSDDGLMSVAGWSSRSMIDRYAGAAAAQRAQAEALRLGLGDL